MPYEKSGVHNSYPLDVGREQRVVDATIYGSVERFMNASCSPTLKPTRLSATRTDTSVPLADASTHVPRAVGCLLSNRGWVLRRHCP